MGDSFCLKPFGFSSHTTCVRNLPTGTVATYCKSYYVPHGHSSRSTAIMQENIGIVCKQHGANKVSVLEISIWMCYTYGTLKNPPGLCANEVIKYREMRGGKWV